MEQLDNLQIGEIVKTVLSEMSYGPAGGALQKQSGLTDNMTLELAEKIIKSVEKKLPK